MQKQEKFIGNWTIIHHREEVSKTCVSFKVK